MDTLIIFLLAFLCTLWLWVNILWFRSDQSMYKTIVSTALLVALIFSLGFLKREYENTVDYCVPYIEEEVNYMIPLVTRRPWYWSNREVWI